MRDAAAAEVDRPSGGATSAGERRVLGVAFGAHALHDGYADALYYLLLPLWRAEFGLPYAAVGALRALASGTMAVFQRPSALAAERLGTPRVLALGTALVGIAWLVAGASATLPPPRRPTTPRAPPPGRRTAARSRCSSRSASSTARRGWAS